MVTSLATRSTVPAPTAKSLGAARARNGVSITETISDFRALFVAAEQRVDIDALQSLAEGWAEVAEIAPPISCTDVYTGLATRAHFQRRIHELSAEVPDASGGHALAVISLPPPREGRSHRWTLLALVGDTVQRTLKGTGAMAMYQNSAIHVLFPVNDGNLLRLIDCRKSVEALALETLSPARLKFYPLSMSVSLTALQEGPPDTC